MYTYYTIFSFTNVCEENYNYRYNTRGFSLSTLGVTFLWLESPTLVVGLQFASLRDHIKLSPRPVTVDYGPANLGHMVIHLSPGPTIDVW